MINTKPLQKLKLVKDWKPTVGAEQFAKDGRKEAAILVGAGATWATVLKEIEAKLKWTTVHGAASVKS